MRLVDTSAWIEWLVASPTGKSVARLLPSRDAWLVPTIVQLELVKWLTREVGEDQTDRVIAFTQRCFVAPLDSATAVAAAELCHAHRLATADAIVLATARQHGATIVTCDAHFKGLSGVTYVAKAKP